MGRGCGRQHAVQKRPARSAAAAGAAQPASPAAGAARRARWRSVMTRTSSAPRTFHHHHRYSESVLEWGCGSLAGGWEAAQGMSLWRQIRLKINTHALPSHADLFSPLGRAIDLFCNMDLFLWESPTGAGGKFMPSLAEKESQEADSVGTALKKNAVERGIG